MPKKIKYYNTINYNEIIYGLKTDFCIRTDNNVRWWTFSSGHMKPAASRGKFDKEYRILIAVIFASNDDNEFPFHCMRRVIVDEFPKGSADCFFMYLGEFP